MVPDDQHAAPGNFLLRALSTDHAALLVPHLEPAKLGHHFVLERPQAPIAHVYFLTSGIASTVATGGRTQRVEVGIFGRDGMSGTAVVLGDDRAPQESFMQVAGEGLRLTSDRLRDAMNASPSLRLVFLRFVQTQLIQTGQTALANAKARVEARLCRWLLMCHDRIDGNTIELTHEFLAMMLGVRRAGVTNAIHLLEGRGLVRARRGAIEILDRDGLKACAEGLYGAPEAEYQRLVGVTLREF